MAFNINSLGIDENYPLILNPQDPNHILILSELENTSQVQIFDEIESQVADLIKSNYPEVQLNKSELSTLVSDFFSDKNKKEYGNWVYFPWKKELVHLLPEPEFKRVRTLRNNYKITPQEQDELSKKKVGIVGLSVGQSVAFTMALERGFGELRLADFDTLELSNLNRLKAGVSNLGLEKVIIAARQIYEIDPYLKITLFRDGVTEENVDNFIESNGKLDLIIDECDSLDIKLLLREKGKEYGVPVIMETSDRGMLDIERFDLDPDLDFFHGYLKGIKRQDLKQLPNKEKVAIVLKITGLDTLSPRMKASLLEVGQSITSWPQLASGVVLGGASVAHVSRRLLLGEKVSSGRYYVDFDEIIPLETKTNEDLRIDNETGNFVENEELISSIPHSLSQSPYRISLEELEGLLEIANLAPSGGNIQPWIWILDKKGNLHLFHDKKRSESMLDYLGTGSLIAFGAALENFRLIAATRGFEIEIINQIKEFEQTLIASIRFIAKYSKPILVPHFELVDGIKLRCTNRKNNDRVLLDQQILKQFEQYALEEGLELSFIEDESKLSQLAKVVGGMDRMRFFHEQGLDDFIKEVRWTQKDAIETKDGIDIETLELGATERAAMGLLKDPRTVKFFRKFFLGYGLTKISKDTMMTASSIGMIRSENFDAISYLKAGAALQRVWIKANMKQISFQPVAAMCFMFHFVKREKENGFSQSEINEINSLEKTTDLIFGSSRYCEPIFMFRLNVAGEPSIRSYRREVKDTLIII